MAVSDPVLPAATPRSRAGSPGSRPPRAAARLVAASLVLTWAGSVLAADEVTLPPRIQAELLAKILGYDRGLTERAAGQWRILILRRVADAESERVAQQFAGALAELRTIQSLRHVEMIEDFVDGAGLVAACRDRRVTVVYVTPGLAAEVPSIVQALSGQGVLTVAAVPDFVPRGLVLGFDLVSGKKQILLSLAGLRTQGIRFAPGLLNLARVYP